MLSYYMLSKDGDRDHNEDSVGSYKAGDTYSFVLCDGLGGHGKGEVASALAVESGIACMAELGENPASEADMDRAFFAAQDAVLKKQEEEYAEGSMKTTMVMLRINPQDIIWGHIGDSRLYAFLNDRIVEQTLDHSVPQMLVTTGEIKMKDIRNHPDRNRLLRVVGTEWDGKRFTIHEPVARKGRQAFLLCSDGFWELIEEKDMEKTLRKASTPEAWILQMESIVLKNGAGKNMDNYSAIAVFVEGDKDGGSKMFPWSFLR